MKLDTIHSKILEQLQINARISNTAIAKQVGISSPAVTERIKKLEDSGVIEGYYAKVSHLELGYHFRALITGLTSIDITTLCFVCNQPQSLLV